MSERMISETGCYATSQLRTAVLRIVQTVKNAVFFSRSQGLAWILRYDGVPARGGRRAPSRPPHLFPGAPGTAPRLPAAAGALRGAADPAPPAPLARVGGLHPGHPPGDGGASSAPRPHRTPPDLCVRAP